MKCPKCQRENETTSQFCIFCGSPLQAPEPKPAVEPAPLSLEILSQQLQALREEVNQLKDAIAPLLGDRLAAMERTQGIAEPLEQPVATPSVQPASTTEPQPVTPPLAVPPQPESVPVLPIEEVPPPPVVIPVEKEPAKPREWEQILGGNWLARIGVLALIIGVAFFLKLAFDNEWIGPVTRIIMGIMGGLAMLAGGYFWQKRYPVFAQALTGGGIALLYLSIFAAFTIYRLIPIYPAVGSLFLVSVGSSVLAMRHNSMALAILGIFGAFCAPFILGYSAPRELGVPQTGQGLQLLAYIMIVDIGVLVLSTFRNWHWFTMLALLGSLIAYGGWYGDFGAKAGLLVSQGSLTLIFLIFVGATVLFSILWRRISIGFDYSLMVINAAAYFGISYSLMWANLRVWIGVFTLLLALFYAGLAYIARRRSAENTALSFFALGIALIFLTIAVPVQLGDKSWTTIAWAAEGAILMWLSLTLSVRHFRRYSYAAFSLVALRLLFFDTSVNLRTYYPVINERVLAFLLSIVAMYFTSYIAWRHSKTSPEHEKDSGIIFPVFFIAANFFSLWLMGAEVINTTSVSPRPPPYLTPLFLVVFAGATTLYYLVCRRTVQAFDLIIMLTDALFYIIISTLLWERFRVWMGGIYLIIALFYGGLTYAMLKRGTENTRFALFSQGVALVFFTLAVPVQFADSPWTTVAWAGEMLALMWFSSTLPMPQLRYYCYAVFVLMAGRLLFFDTPVYIRTFIPIINERFLAFAVSIAAMYLCAHLLWRQRERLPDWHIPASTLLVAANLFSIWLLSFEVWDYFGSLRANLSLLESAGPSGSALRNAQNLSLTALWAIYATVLLVIGIKKRWRLVRLWALALLAIPIAKVFVYDIFALERVYRIIAFIGLGILLLVSGNLYQRYSKAIRGFLVKKD